MLVSATMGVRNGWKFGLGGERKSKQTEETSASVLPLPQIHYSVVKNMSVACHSKIIALRIFQMALDVPLVCCVYPKLDGFILLKGQMQQTGGCIIHTMRIIYSRGQQ